MTRSIVAGPVFTGVPLDELKQWLAITGTRDDEVLASLLDAAHATCAQFTGLTPLTATYDEMIAPAEGWIALAPRPMRFIGDLNEKGTDGSERTLASDEYEKQILADGTGRIRLKSAVAETRIEVRITVGTAGSWSELEPALRQGIIRLAAHNFRERDTGDRDMPPAAVAALWRPIRRLRL